MATITWINVDFFYPRNHRWCTSAVTRPFMTLNYRLEPLFSKLTSCDNNYVNCPSQWYFFKKQLLFSLLFSSQTAFCVPFSVKESHSGHCFLSGSFLSIASQLISFLPAYYFILGERKSWSRGSKEVPGSYWRVFPNQGGQPSRPGSGGGAGQVRTAPPEQTLFMLEGTLSTYRALSFVLV